MNEMKIVNVLRKENGAIRSFVLTSESDNSVNGELLKNLPRLLEKQEVEFKHMGVFIFLWGKFNFVPVKNKVIFEEGIAANELGCFIRDGMIFRNLVFTPIQYSDGRVGIKIEKER